MLVKRFWSFYAVVTQLTGVGDEPVKKKKSENALLREKSEIYHFKMCKD